MALAAGAIVGTWFWDVPNDQLTVDEALARAFGLDPTLAQRKLQLHEVLGTVHPDDLAGLTSAIEHAVRHGGRFAHQYRTRGTDGGYHWLESIGRVDLDENGRALRFPGVLIDIDERLRVQAERDQAQALLRSFVEAAPGVMYAKDRQGRLLMGNSGTTALIGRPPAEYVGRTDAELLANPAQAAAVMATDERVMSSGRSEQVEEEVSFPDGRRAWWLSTKAPLRNGDGEVIGLVGTSLDITDRKSAEAERLDIEERYRLGAQAPHQRRDLGLAHRRRARRLERSAVQPVRAPDDGDQCTVVAGPHPSRGPRPHRPQHPRRHRRRRRHLARRVPVPTRRWQLCRRA